MKQKIKNYALLCVLLGSLLTGLQIFGSGFLVLWSLNEVRVGLTIAFILAGSWLISKVL